MLNKITDDEDVRKALINVYWLLEKVKNDSRFNKRDQQDFNKAQWQVKEILRYLRGK